jgi:amino acid transporter
MASTTTHGERDPILDAEGLNRGVGILGLLWASEGSIIGSGWLFGPLGAVAVAGPSAIFGWVIASVVILVLALAHAELGGLFPVSGGTSRFPHYAFGSFAGATFGWFSYVQALAVVPIEVAAMLQYLSSATWAHGFYNDKKFVLTGSGLWIAAALVVFFTLVNLVGIQWLARTNTGITTWKVAFPIFAILVLLLFKWHSGNFTADGGFWANHALSPGGPFKAIVETFPTGVIFALLGFEQAVQLGGESANPKRDLPRAVIGSVLIGMVIYIGAQLAFIAALDPSTVLAAKTWANLPAQGHIANGPFYTLAKLAGVAWLAWLLRFDAVVSPGGTGLIYLTSASRIGYGLSRNGFIPKEMEDTRVRNVPWIGIIVTAVLGFLMLLPFPSWASLVGVITSASVMMYAAAPLALGALRKQKPDLPRVYTLPYGGIMAPVAFTLANFVIYYAGWSVYSTLMALLVIGFIIMGVSVLLDLNPNRPPIDWQAALWIFPYLIGLGLISYFGSFPGAGGPSSSTGAMFDGLYGFQHDVIGGHGDLPFGWDFLVIGVFSFAIYFLAVYLRLPDEKVDYYVREVYPPPVG